MTALSNFAEDNLLDHILGTASYTSPGTVYLGLFTSDPGDDNSGTEVSGGGYARKSIGFNASSGGSASNSSTVSWTASGGDFGTVTHIALFDASTAGNQLMHAALNSSKTIVDGDTIEFAAGDITWTLD